MTAMYYHWNIQKLISVDYHIITCTCCSISRDTRNSFWTKNEITKFSILHEKRNSQFWTKFGQKMANWSPKKLSNSFTFIGITVMLLQFGWQNGCLELLGCEWINFLSQNERMYRTFYFWAPRVAAVWLIVWRFCVFLNCYSAIRLSSRKCEIKLSSVQFRTAGTTSWHQSFGAYR